MAKDTFELSQQLIKGVSDKENAARRNDMRLYRAQTIKYSISPLYARYVGDTVTVAYNGNFKKFPVNGTQFDITIGHYNALMKYLHHIDRQIKIAKTNAKFIGDNVVGDFKKI